MFQAVVQRRSSGDRVYGCLACGWQTPRVKNGAELQPHIDGHRCQHEAESFELRKCNCRTCIACEGSGRFKGERCPRCIDGIRCRHPDDPKGILRGVMVLGRGRIARAYCKFKGLPQLTTPPEL